MAVRPLRPATDRRLGRPLPHQQANRTRVPLQAPGLAIPDFDHRPSKGGMLCGISPPFGRLSPTRRQVTHAILTRLPLYLRPEGRFRVRLACVRHAASVNSEPGSNSQVKDVASGHSHEWPSGNFNTRALLRLFVVQSVCQADTRRVCFVVLSSFQRADAKPGLPSRTAPPLHRSPLPGNPLRLPQTIPLSTRTAIACISFADGLSVDTAANTEPGCPPAFQLALKSSGMAH